MKLIPVFLMLLCMALSFQACETTILEEAATAKKTSLADFELGQEFVLPFESNVRNASEGILIEFTAVEEGRCPYDVQCVWAGNAEVSLQLIINGNQSNVSLNTNDTLQKSASFFGYSIRLIKLSPYPESSENPIPIKMYEATLIVEKSAS